MNVRKPIVAVPIAIATLVLAACGSTPPGGSDSSEGGSGENTLGIDVADCATDPTEELSGEVSIGQTLAQSGGPAAAFAPIGEGLQAAFATANEAGDSPLTFNLQQRDDQFAPEKAATGTQELIAQENVAAMTTTIGTPGVLAVRPILETACVPLIAGSAGGSTANSPDEFPWTVIFTLPSTVDARIWVENVQDRYPDGATVALFHANDASGADYAAAVERYVEGTNIEIVATQTIENTDAAAPASQVTTLRSSEADVLLAAPTGAQCGSLLREVANQGWDVDFYMASTCSSALFDQAGAAADGVYIVQYVKDPSRAPYNADPAVQEAVENLAAHSPGTAVTNSSINAFAFAQPLIEASRLAEDSELGLSRLGLLEAATHMTFQPDVYIDGVQYSLNYPDDQVAIESGQLTQYVAGSRTFTDIEFYDFEGEMTGVATS